METDAAAVRREIMGRLSAFSTPFGGAPSVYADWTASGKPLLALENYLSDQVLPMYGNTHTTTSVTGAQSTLFRHEAREIIGDSLNAKLDGPGSEDCVLFTGNGSTAAIAKLVQLLGLSDPLLTAGAQRPVVIVGPWEHHSNLLPWRESCADVVTVQDTAWSQPCGASTTSSRKKGAAGGQAGIDLQHLEALLKKYARRSLVVGAFSAASNLTGALCDMDAVTVLLHKYGALACWDCATAAPHIKLDMNPAIPGRDAPYAYKDAMFISGHKFVGGPGTPGLLVIKRRLMGKAVPTAPGGGTVFFVTPNGQRYLRSREEREEAGTPDVIGAARLGLVMQLHEKYGGTKAEAAEQAIAQDALTSLLSNPNITVLGANSSTVAASRAAQFCGTRLPVLSFLIKHGSRFLHYNFVCALLNDLFGVQARGGCMCAGPYAMRLLGLSADTARMVETQLLEQEELLRPGFTRLSLTYFNSAAELEHILSAIHFVADKGYLFLPEYTANHATGEWKHVSKTASGLPGRRWLANFDLAATPSAASTTATTAAATASEDGEHNNDVASSSEEINPPADATAATAAATAFGVTTSVSGLSDSEEEELLLRIQARARDLATAIEQGIRVVSHTTTIQQGNTVVCSSNTTSAAKNVTGSLSPAAEALRWFVCPFEGSAAAVKDKTTTTITVQPYRYFLHNKDDVADGWDTEAFITDTAAATACRSAQQQQQGQQMQALDGEDEDDEEDEALDDDTALASRPAPLYSSPSEVIVLGPLMLRQCSDRPSNKFAYSAAAAETAKTAAAATTAAHKAARKRSTAAAAAAPPATVSPPPPPAATAAPASAPAAGARGLTTAPSKELLTRSGGAAKGNKRKMSNVMRKMSLPFMPQRVQEI